MASADPTRTSTQPGFKILSGHAPGAYGRWIVIDRAADVISRAGKRGTTWNCVCECGTRARVRAASLLNGQSKSCGCLRNEVVKRRNSSKGFDLTGRTFGYLKVLSLGATAILPSGHKTRTWVCECQCGYVGRFRSKNLLNGHTKSCGCLGRALIREKKDEAFDMIGRMIGRWTVIERAEDRVASSGIRVRQWLCRCSCGTEKVVLANSLRRGDSRSCGCLRREVLPEARRMARLRRQVESVSNKVSASNKTASTVLPVPA